MSDVVERVLAALNARDVDAFVVQEEHVRGREPDGERHVAIYLVRDGAVVRERLLR